ncbi:MAG: zinc ribbon domain-containing protein [Actinomycetia bacterium]|nr:zinc ribbon domain-containing protein [Actinomycetes bacterium]
MFCPSCGAAVQSGQKFCTSCGSALAGAATPAPASSHDDATPTPPQGQPLPPPPATSSPATAPATTVLAATTGASPAAAVVTGQYPAAGYEGPAWDAAGGDWEPTGMAPVVGGVQPFRITPLVATASLAAVLAVASAFVDVAGIDVTDQSGFAATKQVFKLNDFSSNLTVGAILAALLLVIGASLGATGRRVGTGLAGGAGLALAGMMGMMLGQVTQLFDSTEFGLLGTGTSFTLTTTRDIGFWLAVVSALLGGAAFVLSFEGAGHDGHPPISPAIGALGLLGTAMAVIGPMIPMNDAPFGDQFSNDFTPPATLLLRQLVLILIAVGGVVGFTRNRRWGLGLALGAISVAAWQLITAATESGDIPLSYAGGNPGALDFAPHTVTIIGVVAMILAGVAGLIVAAQRNAS